ncbi:hypothetical protein LINGRAHAP2_LOCUS14992 [Linum grandiflorum]
MHEYEYMTGPDSLDKEMFTLCKLKRKRDKKMPTNTINHHASANFPEAFQFGDQISPFPQGESCYNIQQITCDSSDASHLVGSEFGNQMSPTGKRKRDDVLEQEYSEANCLKASDLGSPILFQEASNGYQVDNQVAWEYNKATCFMASDLLSPASPSTLESHSAWDNDGLGQVVDSINRIHQYQNIHIDASSCSEVEPACSSGTATPKLEYQKQQMEKPILSASDWNWLDFLFQEGDLALVDHIATS